jgi:Ca2+/Na+ antiporter
MIDIENIKTSGYILIQSFLILVLVSLPESFLISSLLVLILLALTILIHSHNLINSSLNKRNKILAFILILLSLFFIPIYSAFQTIFIKLIGVSLIILHLIFVIYLLKLKVKKDNKKNKEPKYKDLKKEKEELKNKNFAQRKTESIKKAIKKSTQKRDYKLVAVVGGSKFHSLECKMVENKPKKKLKYYVSAQEALNDGLRPCKLCKAVNYLHQL